MISLQHASLGTVASTAGPQSGGQDCAVSCLHYENVDSQQPAATTTVPITTDTTTTPIPTNDDNDHYNTIIDTNSDTCSLSVTADDKIICPTGKDLEDLCQRADNRLFPPRAGGSLNNLSSKGDNFGNLFSRKDKRRSPSKGDNNTTTTIITRSSSRERNNINNLSPSREDNKHPSPSPPPPPSDPPDPRSLSPPRPESGTSFWQMMPSPLRLIKMTSSYLLVSSLMVLFVATLLLMVALGTSHWLRIGNMNRHKLCSCTSCDCGMWFACSDPSRSAVGGSGGGGGVGLQNRGVEPSSCEWFVSSAFPRESLPDWFKATQALVTVAMVSSMASLLIGLCSLCAPYNLHRIVTIVITCTAVLLTVAVSVFGTMVSQSEEVVGMVLEGFDHHRPYLSWSYWLAVAATLVAWLTSLCFFLLCRLHCRHYFV